MKLSDAAKQYEKCNPPGPCLLRNCPLHKYVRISISGPDAEWGSLTWDIEGCLLMGKLEDFLRNKKPGGL